MAMSTYIGFLRLLSNFTSRTYTSLYLVPRTQSSDSYARRLVYAKQACLWVLVRNDSKELWDWVVLVGNTWKSHGQDIACCCPYLPGSFDCPPRNPAKKISSGYKAWEFLIYVFRYCPALLYNVLPPRYWRNFCKLVSAVHLL